MIRNIDEFERDVYLMFCNANMYNSDTALESDMAKEMFDEAKSNIQVGPVTLTLTRCSTNM